MVDCTTKWIPASHTVTVYDEQNYPVPMCTVVMGWVFHIGCWVCCIRTADGWFSCPPNPKRNSFRNGDAPTHWHALVPDIPDEWFGPPTGEQG